MPGSLALADLSLMMDEAWWCKLVACTALTEKVPAQGKPVCAAVFRVFGPQLAEVPLVATRALTGEARLT